MYSLFIIFAATLWGTTGLFSSYLVSLYNFTTLQIGGLRVFSTSILLALFLALFNRKLFKFKLKDIWVFVGTGIISLTFFTLCYFESIKFNGVAVAAVLLYTAPIFVAIISSVVFKCKISVVTILSIVLAVLGCFFVSGVVGSNLINFSGIGLLVGLGSGFGYSLYTIFAKIAASKGYESLTITFYTFLFSSIALIPCLLLSDGFAVNEISNFQLGFETILFGLITGVLPYIFYTKGLKVVSPTIASITSTFEPVVATFLGVFILHEKLSVSAILGVVLILLSLIVGSLHIKKVE